MFGYTCNRNVIFYTLITHIPTVNRMFFQNSTVAWVKKIGKISVSIKVLLERYFVTVFCVQLSNRFLLLFLTVAAMLSISKVVDKDISLFFFSIFNLNQSIK